MKRIDPKSKPGGVAVVSKVGGQKALPSTVKATTQKALPSTTPMKALTAPPLAAAVKKELPKTKAAYQPPSSTYTPSKPATSAYQPPKSAVGAYQPPKSAVGAPKSVVGAATKKVEPIKSRTLSTGKVVASKASLPSAVKAPSLNLPAANAPRAVRGIGGGYKPPASKAVSVAGGAKPYTGPIPGFGGAPKAPPVADAGYKAPPSKAGSVVGGPKFF